MCKYVIVNGKLVHGNVEEISKQVHTECGYLLDKEYVEHRLSCGNDICEFCGDVIDYGSQENRIHHV